MKWKEHLHTTVPIALIAIVLLFLAWVIFTPATAAHAAPVTTQVFNGGTGTSTLPAYGQILIGGKSGEYEYVSSSTLGAALGAVTSVFGRSGVVTAQSGDYTTTLVPEGSNLYYTTARALASFITNLAATTSVASITTLPSLSLPYTQVTGTPAFFSYPFPSNATSTLINFSGGIQIASLSGLVGANNGTLYAVSTSTLNASISGNAGTVTNGVYTTTFNSLFDPRFVTDLAATTSVASITTLPTLSLPYSQLTGTPTINTYTATWPITLTSTAFGFNGLSTSTAAVVGNVPYFSGVNTFANEATGTIAQGTGITVTGTGYDLGAGVSIANAGVISLGNGTGIACSGTNPGTCSFANQSGNTVLTNQASGNGVPSGEATTTFGNTLYGVGTAGKILAELSTGAPSWVATTTFSSPLLYSAGNVTCQTATGSLAGCLSSADWTTFNSKQSTISVTWPITLAGSTIGFGGLSTTTNLTVGQVPYVTGVNTFGQEATGTISNGTNITVTGGPGYVLGSGITIGLSGVVGVANGGTGWGAIQSGTIPYGNGTGALSTTTAGTAGQVLALLSGVPTWTATTTFSSPLLYSAGNVTCQTATGSVPGCLSAADWTTFNGKQSTIAVTWPIILTGSTISFGGLGTTTPLTVSDIPYVTGVNTFGQIATSTLTPSAPLTGSFTQLGSAGTLGLGTVGYANGGTGSTTGVTGQLAYYGATAMQSEPTTTVSCSGSASCSSFVIPGSSPVTISASGGGGGSGNVATSTHETSGSVAYFTSNSATPALLGQEATGTIAQGTGITVMGTGYSLNAGVTIANAGVISVSCPGGFLSCSGTNPSSFTLGTLGVANGGTGWAAIQAGTIPYGNGTGALSTTTAATAGQILAFLNGVPTWTATTTFSTGLTYAAGNVTVNTTQNISTLSNLTTGFVQAASGVLSSAALTSSNITTALGFTPQPAGFQITTTTPLSISNLAYFTGVTPTSVGGVATTSVSCSGTVSCTAFTVLGASPITLTGSSGGSGTYPFTPTANFGVTMSATGTPILDTAGLYASSTVIFGSTGNTSQLYWDNADGRLGIGGYGPGNNPPEILSLQKPTGNFTTMRFDSGTTQGYFFAYDGTPEVSLGSNSNAVLNFKVNNATEAFIPTGQGGFTDQSSTGQHSWLNINAPSANPQESTLTTRLQVGASANDQFVDWTLENYGTDNQGSINIGKTGASSTVPFSIRFWNADLGNIAANGVYAQTWLPNGTIGFGVSTSTAGTNGAGDVLYAASSTATNLLQLDGSPGTHLLTFTGAGNFGVGTSTPGTLFGLGNLNGINFNPTATSTFGTGANGININNGCFSIRGTCVGTGAGAGTVTSVGLSLPTGFTVTNSPVTTTGTLTATLNTGFSIVQQSTYTVCASGCNYTSIQPAIDAASTSPSGAVIYVKAGTYTITNPIKFEGNSITVVGEGWSNGGSGGTQIDFNGGTVATATEASCRSVSCLAFANTGYKLSNLEFVDTSQSGAKYSGQGSCVDIGYTDNWIVDHVQCYGIKNGIWGWHTLYATIENNEMDPFDSGAGKGYGYFMGGDQSADGAQSISFVGENKVIDQSNQAATSTIGFYFDGQTNNCTAGTCDAEGLLSTGIEFGPDGYDNSVFAYVETDSTIAIAGVLVDSGATQVTVSGESVLNGTSDATDFVDNGGKGVVNTLVYQAAFNAHFNVSGVNEGVGTSSPWGLLSVNPTAGSLQPAFVIGSSTATLFQVSAGGFVGVGTSTPFSLLSVSGTTANALAVSDSFNTTDLLFGTASTTGPIFDVAATTTPSLLSPITLFSVDQYGHLAASSTPGTPTVGTCGTTPTLATGSNDDTGTINAGSGGITACTLTFGNAYATTPTVVVSDNSTAAVVDVSAVSTTAFTVSFASSLTSPKIYYIVIQP